VNDKWGTHPEISLKRENGSVDCFIREFRELVQAVEERLDVLCELLELVRKIFHIEVLGDRGPRNVEMSFASHHPCPLPALAGDDTGGDGVDSISRNVWHLAREEVGGVLAVKVE
jgi:hypothetical protein